MLTIRACHTPAADAANYSNGRTATVSSTTIASKTTKRAHNFNAGPAAMPLPVLEKMRDELLSYGGTGMSVMEMSHRSAEF